jgi:hypothetical protein
MIAVPQIGWVKVLRSRSGWVQLAASVSCAPIGRLAQKMRSGIRQRWCGRWPTFRCTQLAGVVVGLWIGSGGVQGSGDVTNLLTPANLLSAMEGGGTVGFKADGLLTFTNTILVAVDTILDASGRQVTLSGSGGADSGPVRLFNVNAGVTFVLVNLTLANGESTNGGAIYSQGTLVLTNCTLIHNQATGDQGLDGVNGPDDAGGIEHGGSGGAGSSARGGAVLNLGEGSFYGCVFATNQAAGGAGGNVGNGGNNGGGGWLGGNGGDGGGGGAGLGGALYNLGKAFLQDCTFVTNAATGGNGGIAGTNGSGTLPGLPGSGGQGALGAGAGIYNEGWLSIVDCAFHQNAARGGDSAPAGGDAARGNGDDGWNGGDCWGGAVCNLGTNALVNSTFFANSATGGTGGKGGAGAWSGGDGGDGGNALGGALYNSTSKPGAASWATNCTWAGSKVTGGLPGLGNSGTWPGGDGQNGSALGGNLANIGGSVLLLQNSIVAYPLSGTNIVTVTNVVTTTNITYTTNSINCVTNAGFPGFPPIVSCTTNVTSSTNLLTATNVITIGTAVGSVNVYGIVTDRGYNLSSDATPILTGPGSTNNTDPLLDMPKDNGLSTDTIALLPGSPAIDQIPRDYPPTDQRGVLRPVGAKGDIGAYELVYLFSVSGRVTQGAVGLTNIAVTLGDRTADTDANGNYRLGDLPAGSYTVSPVLPGYDFTPPNRSVTVGPDSPNVTQADFAANNVFRIGGRITEYGAGLSNVPVALGDAATSTDPDGYFTFANLAAGTYAVLPTLAGFDFDPPIRSVTVGPNVTNLDFRATGIFTISGRISDGANGLGDISVALDGRTNTTTDPDGRYRFAGVGGRRYSVTPTRSGYGFTPANLSLAIVRDVSDADFIGFRVFTLVGRIANPDQGGGLSNTVVTASGRAGSWTATSLTDAQGDYSFTNVPEGAITVVPSSAGYVFEPRLWSVTLIDNTNLSFQAYPLYDIRGRITVAGVGLPGVPVRAGTDITITDSAGDYAIQGLLASRYTVTPALAGYSFTPPNAVVQLGPSATEVDFTATGTLSINGWVTQQNGDGLGGVTVAVSNRVVTTLANGAYAVTNLTPASYQVTPYLARYLFLPPTAEVSLETDPVTANFTAIPAFNISGRVVEGSSHGIGGVMVAVTNLTRGAGSATNTDLNGYYTLVNVPGGSNRLAASLGGYGFIPPQIVLFLEANASDANFTNSGLHLAIAMTTEQQAELSGYGLPTNRYLIQATGHLGPATNWLTLTDHLTDANGYFRYVDTAATNYTVRFYRSSTP